MSPSGVTRLQRGWPAASVTALRELTGDGWLRSNYVARGAAQFVGGVPAWQPHPTSQPAGRCDQTFQEGTCAMRRVVAIANGKGGVGKTTLAAGLAGQVAAAGQRVLVVDTDPQGNMGRDLGYGPQDGSSLGLAITHGLPIDVIRDVRDRLDVVPGGRRCGMSPRRSPRVVLAELRCRGCGRRWTRSGRPVRRRLRPGPDRHPAG